MLIRNATSYLRDRIDHDPNVEVLLGHEVRELAGEGHLEQVTTEDARTRQRRMVQAGARPHRRRTAHAVAHRPGRPRRRRIRAKWPSGPAEPARSRPVEAARSRPIPGRDEAA